MKYRIFRTDQFSNQLNDIIFYIAEDASVDMALDILEQIESSVLRLGDFPESGSVPRYSALRRQGYRVVVVMRRLIFYKLDQAQKTVMLYAITDQRQEYNRML